MDLNPTQHLGLSPPKESGNREFFFLIHWGAMDLGKWKSGIWRESAGKQREFPPLHQRSARPSQRHAGLFSR